MQQISVFLENKAGRVAEVARCLSQAGVSIRAITITDTADFGILRLVTDKVELAKAALEVAGFTIKLNPVVAVEINDHPGALAELMELFHQEAVNIEYLYASLEKNRNGAVIIFKVVDREHCRALLKSRKLKLVDSF